MTRLSETILVQLVEDVGLVVIDEAEGTEIVIPNDVAQQFAEAVVYLADHIET